MLFLYCLCTGVGLSRPGSVDLEPEPEAAYRAGGRAGGGGAGVANYVDLDHEEDLTASMRPYAHMVQDVSERLPSLVLAAVRACLRFSR